MGPRGVIQLLIWIVIACLVLWLAWWVIAWMGIPDPLGRILFVLIALLVLLGFLDQAGVWSWRSKPPP
jgi:hypothetical protein